MMFSRPRIERSRTPRRSRGVRSTWLLVLGRPARVSGDLSTRRGVVGRRVHAQTRSLDCPAATGGLGVAEPSERRRPGAGVEGHLVGAGGVAGRSRALGLRSGAWSGGGSQTTATRRRFVSAQPRPRPAMVRTAVGDRGQPAQRDSARRRETRVFHHPVRATSARHGPGPRCPRDVSAARPVARLARRDVFHARCLVGRPGTSRRGTSWPPYRISGRDQRCQRKPRTERRPIVGGCGLTEA